MFLFGHLIWATGFMFLISWRGYWQELIETLVWAHQRTPIANLVGWRDKPVIVGQEMLNADLGANYHGIQITSGIFQMWRGGIKTSIDVKGDLL